MAQLRVRRSIQDLEADYNLGKRHDLETVIRAFKGVQELKEEDCESFFAIAGFHGEPFRNIEWPDYHEGDYIPPDYWGGYCNHYNVLFPTWHRTYLYQLENAMRKVPGCEDVTIPFWDECLDKDNPIPNILTEPEFLLDGKMIPNPLCSYTLPKELIDTLGEDRQTKPKGYRTCRFPLSGLVGTTEDREQTRVYNAQYSNAQENVAILSKNVSNWLKGEEIITSKEKTKLPCTRSVYKRFKDCLKAPNYTVFSNKQSADWYNTNLEKNVASVVSLEDPHNAMHLAVGGFYQRGVYKANPDEYLYANGDMGDNATASMDPIFFLHHAFIDYVFWRWQKKNQVTQRGSLKVIKYYPGSNSGLEPGPNTAPYTNLTFQTPLYPFRNPSGDENPYYTSDDVTDIEKDLGYTYGWGSMDRFSSIDDHSPVESEPAPVAKKKRAYGINRAQIKGSFVVRTYVKLPKDEDGNEYHALLGAEAILSRWNVEGCANCQNSLPVEAFTDLSEELVSELNKRNVDIESDVRIKLQRYGVSTLKDSDHGAPGGVDVDEPKFEVF